jgi:RND family efflux transporter MFP subunit
VDVGSKIIAGQILATQDDADLTAQVAQAKAALANQLATLVQLEQGTRPEELQIAQTNVINAQKALADAQANLSNVRTSADTNLRQVYDGALSATAKSVAVGTNSLFVLTDIQYAHFTASDQKSNAVASAKADAIAALLGGIDAGRWTNDLINRLNGGTKATVQNAQNNPISDNIDQALGDVSAALSKIKTALEVVPITTDLTTTEKTNLNTEKNNINAEITTITGKQQSIDVQKATNDYNITTAGISVTSAQNTLAAAQDQLALKKAGSTPEQIKAQQAQVQSAQANVDNLQVQLAKTVMHSPIDGIVTKQETKVGEIVSLNVPIISIISVAQFEIEANVSEADIAKVRVGENAAVTLDAYGSNVLFDATVVKIDPAETIIEGVATYKVTLQFVKEDGRIKSGMTANIDVLADKRENVLIIPQRAVTQKNNEQFVTIVRATNQTQEQKITTGLKGSDGNIEVLSGLNEGEKILGFNSSVQ